MKNYQFNRNLFLILVIVIGILALGIYWTSFGTGCPCGTLVLPPQNREKIAFNSFHVNSPTNVTLIVSSVGNITVDLADYYVKDDPGDQYANTAWSGPTISPGVTASVNILLMGQLIGQPFQFQTGHTYTIVLVTARNTAFPCTFTP